MQSPRIAWLPWFVGGKVASKIDTSHCTRLFPSTWQRAVMVGLVVALERMDLVRLSSQIWGAPLRLLPLLLFLSSLIINRPQMMKSSASLSVPCFDTKLDCLVASAWGLFSPSRRYIHSIFLFYSNICIVQHPYPQYIQVTFVHIYFILDIVQGKHSLKR